MRSARYILLCAFALSIVSSYVIALTCSASQTASYLTAGTDHVLLPKTVDYVVVVDRSGSMDGVKLNTVKEAAKSLINQLPQQERAAIISFNYDATVHQGLTNNHQLLDASVDAMKAEFGTQYAPPLRAAAQQFGVAGKDKALIFLSDGKSDFGETPEAILDLADGIISQGVCIFTVSYALGGETSELLKEMAERSKVNGCGEHYIASEKGTELEQVFSSIHDTLSATELITITPRLGNATYTMEYASNLNDLPLPGQEGTACAEEPALVLQMYRNQKLVATLGPNATGPLQLPAGEYTYKATANLKCDGACSYTGTTSGTLEITGVCDPTYADLATYVTGETQVVRITDQGFLPPVVSGRQGTVILWQNNDTQNRRVSSAYFDQIIEPGDSYKYVIGNIGTLVYSDPDRNISGQISPIKGTGTDVLLIIDESGSMKGPGIEEAKDAAHQFFELLSPVDRGALLTFSQDAHLLQDFTSDKQLLHAAAAKIVSKGPTNYLTALNLASTVRRSQKSVLVFMSDGTPTDPEGTDAIYAQVERLRADGWCIMTVGFGKEAEQATRLLSAMAGDDQCSAFLYASTGSLARTFGTIYQLSHGNNDLLFEDLHVPIVTFTKEATIRTLIQTKTGNTVPGGQAVCSPPALVQARSSAGSVDLTYQNKRYEGVLPIGKMVEHVSLIAAVSSPDEPGRTFVGQTGRTVVYIAPWLVAVLIAALIGGIIIYRRSRAKPDEPISTP